MLTFEFLIVNDEVELGNTSYEVHWQDTMPPKEMAHLVANLHYEFQQEISSGRITCYSIFVRELSKKEVA